MADASIMLLEHALAHRERARRALELAATMKSASAAESLTRYAAELQQRARQLEDEAVALGRQVTVAPAAPDVISPATLSAEKGAS